jgi:CRISPR-associated endonuclease Csn1
MLRNEVPLEFASCYKEEYVLKYPLQSLKAKDVNSIIDCRVRVAVKQRLNQFNNNEKEAFKDIENNPVWMDERKTIPIKTVRCFTGLSAVEPVKKNEEGEAIGFVKTGNNHHIAIYSDKEGKKHEHCVTFWNAVERKKYRLPVVIKNPSDVWDLILEKNLPENFLSSLPLPDWKYELSLQQNEMFILGMSPEEFNSAVEAKDYCKFSNYLYRVQKIGACDYTFRFHLETSLKDTPEAKKMKLFYRIQSFSSFFDLAPQSVRINNLGEILPSTGEVLFRKEADSKQEA